jgi:hypothetical protein
MVTDTRENVNCFKRKIGENSPFSVGLEKAAEII